MVLQNHLSGIIQCGTHCRKLDQHLRAVLPTLHHPLDLLQMADSPGEAVEYRLLIFVNVAVGMGNSVGMEIGVIVRFLTMVMGMIGNRFMGMLRHGKRPLSVMIGSCSCRTYILNYYTSRQWVAQALPGDFCEKINVLTDRLPGAIIKEKFKGAIIMHLDHDHVGHSHHDHDHTHEESCGHDCGSCASQCEHTPMEELQALMKYMVGHNAAHAKELADLAVQLDKAGDHTAYERVMAAVSDFEKGNMRLSVVLSAMEIK